MKTKRYIVKSCVCDYCVVDTKDDGVLIILNSFTNAILICKILNHDNALGIPFCLE